MTQHRCEQRPPSDSLRTRGENSDAGSLPAFGEGWGGGPPCPTGATERAAPGKGGIGRVALLTILMVLFAGLGGSIARAEPEICPNGAMEAGEPGQPPRGWVANCFGEVDAGLRWKPGAGRAGSGALCLDCRVFRGGAAQVYLPIAPVKAGQAYTLRAWVRGEGLSVPARLQIRDIGPPYRSYLGVTALVTEEWRPIAAIGKATADGGNVGVFFSFQGAGRLWVDDLSLQAGEHPAETAEAPVPVAKGNLVQNSGFELGMQGWTMPEMVAIEEGGTAGRCAHWLNKSGYMLEGGPVALKPGQRYTLSAWLRSPAPGTRVSLAAVEVGGKDRPAKEFTLTDTWARCSFAFTAHPEQSRHYFLSLSRAAGGDFLADSIQLEEGGLTPWAPARPLEAGFDLPRGNRFAEVGRPVRFVVQTSLLPSAAPVPLDLVATDYLGREVQRRAIRGDRRRQDVSLRFAEPRFVSLALVDASSKTLLDEAQLCVLPSGSAGAARDPFFGAHGTEGRPGEYHALTTLAKAGAAAWRLHDLPSYTQWFMVEPEKGRFVWYDQPLDAMRAKGVRVLGVFCRTAEWAGRDPGGEKVGKHAWPPRDLGEFGDYVYRTVEHYKGRIRHWEVWNEPWGRGFWAGTPEEYAKLLEVAYTQAKRADPECVIIGGCFWPAAPEFTDRVLAAGAIKHMDAVSYHHYCEPDAVAMGQVRSWYEHMRAKIDAAGGKALPIWMTEGGTSCPSYYRWLDARDQARAAAEASAKHQIETKSLGVEAFYYYHAWQEIGSPRMFHWLHTNNWVLLEYDGSPKTVYASYAAAAHLLAGARPAGSIERGPWRIHVFSRDGRAVAALWARGALAKPAALRVDLGRQASARDLMGAHVTLTREEDATVLAVGTAPIYLSLPGLDAREVLRRLEAAAAASVAPRG